MSLKNDYFAEIKRLNEQHAKDVHDATISFRKAQACCSHHWTDRVHYVSLIPGREEFCTRCGLTRKK
jgi:hypothetical protein